jgi:RimJ/RimL family protein N-acetyltransferase
MRARRLRVEWWGGGDSRGDRLSAIEPTPDEIHARAAELAAAYNEPHNRAMMAHSADFSADDVIAHYAQMDGEGARQFFLFEGDAFVGDADFRHIEDGRGEFAILIGPREAQGKGLGTRFALLLHALAFDALGIDRVYVTILPENVASRRLFEKVGYRHDPSREARLYVDDDRDVSMSIRKGDFASAHSAVLGGIRAGER